MKELIHFIAQALVDHPEGVEVRETESGRRLELKVAQEDLGRIIGRKGRTAQAMRTLLKVAAGGRGGGPSLDIVGPPESGPE
jgi:predicted RNA-binding protein YlqC (UPF0109 family)